MKHILISTKIFFAAIIFLQHPLHSMNTWYEDAIIYPIMTRITDMAYSVKTNLAFLALAHTKKSHPTLHTQLIKNRLKTIEHNIRHDETNAIQVIFTNYGITKEQQDTIASLTNQYKKIEKEYMLQPQTETTHDKDFPVEIFPILEQNGIHPKGINLINSQHPHPYLNCNATAQSLVCEIEIINNDITISRILFHPKITIYPSFWESPTALKGTKAILLHEVTHLKEQHSTTKTGILMWILNYTNIKISQIKNHQSYKKIETIHERQAEVLPSLQNAENAKTMRNFRSNAYYPGTLYTSHYAQLAEIDELHKLNARLTNYKPMPVQKIDDLRVMKWSIDPKMLKS